MSPAMPEPEHTDDDLDAKLFDYYEGRLSPEERADVERRLEARGEPIEPPPEDEEKYKSGLQTLKAARAAAPAEFTETVTETIHRRSGGRFFGRRTLGDRVPFTLLLLLALALAIAIAGVLWTSSTGSLRVRPEPKQEQPKGGAKDLAPAPGP